MKFRMLIAVAAALSAVACASPAEEPVAVSSTSEALTLQECEDQQAACFSANPLFGLVTCPVQYAQCILTASNGLPAVVTSAITDATDCAQQGLDCVASAEAPSELLACTTEEATCVAAIIDAEIPTVVTGTAECVEGAVSCIEASTSAGDLAACAETLEDCAIDQAVTVLPPAVSTIVGDVGQCTIDLGACTRAAATPSELTACSEQYVECVGDGLGVTVPNVGASDVVHCAEAAASCTFDARSVSDVTGCASDLVECAGDVADQQLTCEQKWTQCLSANPLAFLRCSLELATCQD